MDHEKPWNAEFGIKSADSQKGDGPKFVPRTPSPLNRNGIWGARYGPDLDRVALHGFTMADLVNLGAINGDREPIFLPNNLEGPIHPAFTLARWEKDVPKHFKRKYLFPLRKDMKGGLRPGHYSAHNSLVWKALEPSLRLVSKFVENSHIFPWVSGQFPIRDTR